MSITKNPGRKRTFNPEKDVAKMLAGWQKDNPAVIEARMFNEALRRYLYSIPKRKRYD